LLGNCKRKSMLKVAQFWTILSNFGFSLSRKIRKKIRIFESRFADSSHH
jgi:hypothetical protein